MLASSDIYVSAAPYETFGLAVLEAQASGLPIVGVHAGAMIERVPETLGRLVEPGSPERLAAAIVALWREGARPFGARARLMAETSFSWAHTFRHVFPLYHEALARTRLARNASLRGQVAEPALR